MRHQSVLNRYVVLLKYGYSYDVNRGDRYWQQLTAARDLRDYYTHLDVTEPRAISSQQVVEFMEVVLLGMICPSVALGRTILLGIYDLYGKLAELSELAEDFVEQPFFRDWPFQEGYMFHCNFDNVDGDRFPSVRDLERYRRLLNAEAERARGNRPE